MILRDDRQVALDEVVVRCKRSADQYREVAGLVSQQSELAGRFEKLADARERRAEQVGQSLHRLGELPRDPDADRELLESLVTRLKWVLTEHQLAPLYEAMDEEEASLEEAVSKALSLDLPDDDTRKLLESLRREVRAARGEISILRK